jgi:two-component system NtrC family sensor kinase
LTNLLNIISKSLAAKLIIALMSLIIVGVGISWYTLIHTGRINLINEAVKDAAGYSDLIKKSIRYDMLTFDREAIQRTLDDLKSATDVKGIKLVSSTGRISHSSAHSEIGRQIDRTARECNGCHVDGRSPSGSLAGIGQWTTYQGAEGYTVLTFIDPIHNEPSCSQAACHVHPPDQRILGILESDFSLASVDKNIQTQMVNTTVYAFALMSVIAAILYLILSKFVLKPVSTLSKAMGRVAQGHLEQAETADSQDEVGRLVGSFNEMTQELKTTREKLQNWTESLEREVAKKSDELKKSQDRLIHAEKLAAMGRLTADVAHEIRNPLTAIGGFARILQKKAAGEKEKKHAEIIVVEVARLEKILKDVLTFSSDVRYHLEKHRIDEVVFDVVKMFKYTCNEQSVTVEVAIEKDLPPILIDREQVTQAFSNLITNALEAMPRGGALSITAGSEFHNDVRYLYVKVFDTGTGVDENKLSLIFEPFFTTQERGRSTGLGLSITRKIMEEHGGFIKAEGTKGKGSTFSLYFPLQSDEDSHKIKCWEYMKCGRDKDATAKCPAHSNFGRICWAVAGTFCEGKVQGTFAQKYENCMKCDFYKMVHKLRT